MPIPKGQQWIIKRMQAIGLPSDKNGVCFGISHMAIQAFLTKDLDQLNARLELINQIPIEAFQACYTLNDDMTFAQRYAPLIKAIKDLSPTKDEKFFQLGFGQHKIINKMHRHFFKPKNNAEEKFSIFEQRAADMVAFFEGIELYHQMSSHTDLVDKNEHPVIDQDKLNISSKLVMSEKVRQSGGIEILEEFTGMYDFKNLQTYLATLQNHLSEPITLALGNSRHIITIAYDPLKKIWFFTDPNQLPTLEINIEKNPETHLIILSRKILSALSKNDNLALSTKVISTKNANGILKSQVKNWIHNSQFKEINAITEKRARLLDSSETSWLTIAAYSNDFETVKALLEKEADPNQATIKTKYTPLHHACSNYNKLMVKSLVEAGGDINARDHERSTPIFFAINDGNTEFTNFLIEQKADISVVDKEKNSLLHFAAQAKNLELVHYFLEKNLDCNARNSNENTSYHLAIISGDLDCIQYLEKHGAKVNLSNKHGNHPLHLAAFNGHTAVIEHLFTLEEYAGTELINSKNNDGNTPLHFAIYKNQPDILNLLLKQDKLKFNSVNREGEAAIHLAAKNNLPVLFEALLNRGVLCNEKNLDNETPLHLAAKSNAGKIIKMLIDTKEITPEQKNKNGDTALSLAIKNGHMEAAKSLMAVTNINQNLKYYLKLASNQDNREIVKSLFWQYLTVHKTHHQKIATIQSWIKNDNEFGIDSFGKEQFKLLPKDIRNIYDLWQTWLIEDRNKRNDEMLDRKKTPEF